MGTLGILQQPRIRLHSRASLCLSLIALLLIANNAQAGSVSYRGELHVTSLEDTGTNLLYILSVGSANYQLDLTAVSATAPPLSSGS